jgi:hypothetical protein
MGLLTAVMPKLAGDTTDCRHYGVWYGFLTTAARIKLHISTHDEVHCCGVAK